MSSRSLQIARPAFEATFNAGLGNPHWYAVFTLPHHEKSVLNHLGLREIESFLPTFEEFRVWKNRQRMKIVMPLFPNYLFIRINNLERVRVLQTPGVLRIVGNHRAYIPIPDSQIDVLRNGCRGGRIEPYRDLVVGDRVRIARGPMGGVEGTLVRRNSLVRFVFTLELINQHAVLQVCAEDLEPLSA